MKLSVVATPIGNLEDITLRALRVLKEADTIICEDTRVTSKLLARFEIAKPLVSFRGSPKEYKRIETLLTEGKKLVLVSDAGTPGVSDPGLELISRVREQFNDLVIETIPGASALTAALSIAGLRAATFTFYGFLPVKKGREKLLAEIAQSPRASIVYESPHRILKTLEWFQKHLSEGRRIGIFRELTKLHEEAVVGAVSEVMVHLQNSQKQRGEFVLIVEGKP